MNSGRNIINWTNEKITAYLDTIVSSLRTSRADEDSVSDCGMPELPLTLMGMPEPTEKQKVWRHWWKFAQPVYGIIQVAESHKLLQTFFENSRNKTLLHLFKAKYQYYQRYYQTIKVAFGNIHFWFEFLDTFFYCTSSVFLLCCYWISLWLSIPCYYIWLMEKRYPRSVGVFFLRLKTKQNFFFPPP